ncbi:unnamed protein product [Prorocentrum cordatum]|uniref:Secreted protein n=1 Tax=Prorocentrum cordatum TaxID=2364126 RepID=A0ABN9TQB3_9DINO|nr:unnamed protein product [Polarella glacialis]
MLMAWEARLSLSVVATLRRWVTPATAQATTSGPVGSVLARRFKEWRRVVHESTQEVFADAAIRGQPSCLEVCMEMCRHGGAPETCFQDWRNESGTNRKDSVCHEV